MIDFLMISEGRSYLICFNSFNIGSEISRRSFGKDQDQIHYLKAVNTVLIDSRVQSCVIGAYQIKMKNSLNVHTPDVYA